MEAATRGQTGQHGRSLEKAVASSTWRLRLEACFQCRGRGGVQVQRKGEVIRVVTDHLEDGQPDLTVSAGL